MNRIRNAILAAADSIQRMPELFNYHSTSCPDEGCGAPGCALGWIQSHLGQEVRPQASTNAYGITGHRFKYGLGHEVVANSARPIGSMSFYDRMDAITALDPIRGPSWRYDANKCAETLCTYADQFHPLEVETPEPLPAHTGIPGKVLTLFEPKKYACASIIDHMGV